MIDALEARLAAVLSTTESPAGRNEPLAQQPGPAQSEPAPYLKRLPAAASPHEQSSAVKVVAATDDTSPEPEDDALVSAPPTIEDGPTVGFDEAAESAFRAEARERGEVVAPPRAEAEAAEEHSKGPMPPLDELVNRIPPNVRDVLEDLFRARFVTVKRFPKKALKDGTST